MYAISRFASKGCHSGESFGQRSQLSPTGQIDVSRQIGEEAGQYQHDDTKPDHAQLQQLGRKIRQRARAISTQTATFISELAAFDEHAGWRHEGARSCTHWLCWRCDLGEVAAREHVRVARSLRTLPHIREQFEQGTLSFSKVRAITRVANTDNEEELIAMASECTAGTLETRVRQYRDAQAADATKKENERDQWQFENRYLSHRWREDGCLHITARLTPEQGAVFLKALSVVEESIECSHYDVHSESSPGEQPSDATGDQPGTQPSRTPSQRRADALCALAEHGANGDAAGRHSDRYQVVVNVDLDTLSSEDEAEHAPDTIDGSPDSEQCCGATTPPSGRSGKSRLEPGSAISAHTARRLSCDASKVDVVSRQGEPLAIGRKSPVIPPAMRRAMMFRDEHRCRFPGCCATRGLQGHHITHWAHGGRTDLDNLVSLCPFHHRLLHEGGFRIHADSHVERCEADISPDSSATGTVTRPHLVFHDRHGLAIGSGWTDEGWDLRRN